MEPILPEHYSASYKRVVERDFSEDDDDYTIQNCTEEQKKENKNLIDLMSRINMTRDSIDIDESIIRINFTKVGLILTDFIDGLSKVLVSCTAMHQL